VFKSSLINTILLYGNRIGAISKFLIVNECRCDIRPQNLAEFHYKHSSCQTEHAEYPLESLPG